MLKPKEMEETILLFLVFIPFFFYFAEYKWRRSNLIILFAFWRYKNVHISIKNKTTQRIQNWIGIKIFRYVFFTKINYT